MMTTRTKKPTAGWRTAVLLALCAFAFPGAIQAQDAPAPEGETVVEEAADATERPEDAEAAGDSAPEEAGEESGEDAATAEQEEEAGEDTSTADEGEDAPEGGTDDAEETEENGETESEAKSRPRWYRGSFEAEFDGVLSDRDSDFDLSQYLRIEADPPKLPRLHLRGALWLHQDLSSDSGKPDVLRDINDASAADVQARLLYLHADIDGVLGDQSLIRIGRQRIQEGAAYNRIDGLYLKKRIDKFQAYVFGGARASIYRDTSDDLVLGGGAAYLPGAHTRIALDGYYAEESRYGVSRSRPSLFFGGFRRPVASEINDSKVTLSLWHNFGVNTRFFARVGMLGSDLEELVLSLNGYIPRLDLLYDIDYRQLFDTVGDTTGDLSPFYQVLGKYREHQTLYIGAHRPLTETITLSLEGEIRNTENDEFYSANRDYVRLAAVLFVEDAFKGFDTATSLEYWDASGGEGYWTITGEISREWEQVDWRAGVDFVRYKDRIIEYDQRAALLDSALVTLLPDVYPGFSYLAQSNATRVVDTRENVYSIFTDIEWEFREDQEIFSKISFEEDDGPDSPYWRIRAGYRIRF